MIESIEKKSGVPKNEEFKARDMKNMVHDAEKSGEKGIKAMGKLTPTQITKAQATITADANIAKHAIHKAEEQKK